MDKNGIYVHIPFCIQKCGYCDFVSFTACDEYKEAYVNAAAEEIKSYKGECADTLYFGGGTPTSLDKKQLIKIIDAVYENINMAENSEITVECNPKTANREYFKALRDSGVNRLSIGVQSLIDSELKYLGRIHSADDAKEAVYSARAVGFENISLDVMFGLKNQTMKSLEYTLKGIADLAPEHVSCYSLMIEEGTPFYKNGERTIAEDIEREMYYYIRDFLSERGFARYEISNFAGEGYASRHNTKYWRRAPYIGIGTAAHSFFGGKRYENTANLKSYIKSPRKHINEITLTENDAMSEFMFLGLRMSEGISEKEFERNFGKKPDEVFDMEKYILLNLLKRENGRIFLTDRGIDVSNTIFSDFIL